MSLLIYSEQSSPRLDYTLDFIFNEVIPCEYAITSDIEFYKIHSNAKLNYSNKSIIENEIKILPNGILFENNLKEQPTLAGLITNNIAILKTDIFSCVFYLVSRYEEYLETEKDEFERFSHTKSIAFQNQFLTIPLVDIWLQELKASLLNQFSNLKFEKKEFKFIPTYDIDIAYSYQHKGGARNIGGLFKDLLKGQFKSVLQRIKVLSGKEKDPYDSFDFLNELHKINKLSPIYFFLLGSGGKLDKNLSSSNPAFRKLIQEISNKNEVGIHPSYRSNDKEEELNIEIQRLNSIASIQTTKSRQHYIRFTLPHTYRKLIEHEISDDYSMGYGSINGFRASTSNSFYWFDLEKNEKTKLRIHPFCFMECNSFFEQKQSLAKTQIEIREFIEQIKAVDGTFISIWHNFSLGSEAQWKSWKELYEYQIEKACQVLN